jgi:hypothetical protein
VTKQSKGGRTECSLGVVDPVRSKQAAESRHEDDAAVVFNRLGQRCDLARFVYEAQVVHQKLDTCTSDCDTPLKRIDRFAATAKVVSHRC